MPAPRPADDRLSDPDRLPARTNGEARDRYLKYMQRSLATVHPSACWRTQPVPKVHDDHSAVTVPDTVRLNCEDGTHLYLKAMQRFTYGDHPDHPGERKVNTLEYAYTLTNDQTLEIAQFAWEWNPKSEIWNDPHVHVLRGDSSAHGYAKHHIATGRVAFEYVLKFAINQLHVKSEVPREQAIAILDEVLDRFNRHKSW